MVKVNKSAVPVVEAAHTQVSDDSLRQYVGYNMKRAFLCIQADINETLKALDLRIGSFSALAVIIENPDITQSRLAQALNIERSGVVVLVDELENAGLINRNKVLGDRRSYALRTTLLGQKKWAEAKGAVDMHEDRVLCDLSEEERILLRSLLSRIHSQTNP
ncbi:MarR family transcriptional regulator [Rhodobacteraceae bacterium RKSG542]|uniref:MarR family winged helix-turn-helix transcriptional regulator n=1 Tax=Pseudovibrio flavus TaxID=2529854 RepID=UPI0012BD038A|nr:MarR family transcriptional regulator [Pseudovibrio flavus]MTI15927.1 MarR family transcriptional regulator [Pseudovibrio flavus]